MNAVPAPSASVGAVASPTTEPTRIQRIDDDLILRRVGAEGMLVPIGRRLVEMKGLVALNATGRLLWDLLAEDRSAEELVAAVLREFEVDAARAGEDVRAFLVDLGNLGMLRL